MLGRSVFQRKKVCDVWGSFKRIKTRLNQNFCFRLRTPEYASKWSKKAKTNSLQHLSTLYNFLCDEKSKKNKRQSNKRRNHLWMLHTNKSDTLQQWNIMNLKPKKYILHLGFPSIAGSLTLGCFNHRGFPSIAGRLLAERAGLVIEISARSLKSL